MSEEDISGQTESDSKSTEEIAEPSRSGPPAKEATMANQAIVEYIVVNRGAYNDEALREQLIAAGYGPAAVEEAFAELRRSGLAAGHARPTWRESMRRGSFWMAFIGYVAMVLIGAYLINWAPLDLQSTLLVASGGAALLLGAVFVAMDRLDLSVRRGVGCAIAVLLGVPFVVVAGLFAYCLLSLQRYP